MGSFSNSNKLKGITALKKVVQCRAPGMELHFFPYILVGCFLNFVSVLILLRKK